MRLVFISIFVLLFSATAANAKYTLCNKTSYALNAAVGYVDGDRLATRGWWRLRPGQCKIVLTERTNPGRYFVYGEAIAGHTGELRTWSGETPLCVETEGFFNLRNQEICRGDPLRQRKFFDVDVTEAAGGNYETDFAEASNYTVYSAEVAGVQRLLKDVGKSIKRIDGAMGRETQRALANYRRENGLAAGVGIDDELIDKLIETANTREEKLGFFYCNKTGAPVWSAIAEPTEKDQYKSRGWWKIEPGDCAKIIKGQLTHDHYYVFGSIEEDAAERKLIGGDKPVCTKAILFEETNHVNCVERDLNEENFRRIEIGGAASATFDFLPDMFEQQQTNE